MQLNRIAFSLLTVGLTMFGTEAVQAASLTTITEGISNIRGITFGPDGTLYAAEPGIGGNGNCQASPSTLFQPICAGNTSSLVRIGSNGQQERLFANFESLAEQPSGNQGAGIADLQFDAQGNAYLITGYAGYPGNRDLDANTLGRNFQLPQAQLNTFPPAEPDQVLNLPNLARLFKADLNAQTLTPLFDFATYEIVNNPDREDVVTNPYDLTINGDFAYVVDGGGNAVYQIKLDGSQVTAIPLPKNIVNSSDIFLPPLPPGAELPEGLLQILPPIPGAPVQPTPTLPDGTPINPFPAGSRLALQSVPTGGTIGPDGALYVGEYVGFPYPENKARIFRIDEDGVPQVFASGFNHITELKFDQDGNLLVLQFGDRSQLTGDLTALPGSLIKLAPNGTRTKLVLAGEGLESADGLTIGPDGKIYVADRGVGPENGSVIRVDAVNPDAETVSFSYNSSIGRAANLLAGEPLDTPGTLAAMQGIAVQPSTGLVYVANGRGIDRIDVFDQQGNYVKGIGSTGTGPGQFDEPAAIAFEPGTGNLYVGDVFNNRVNVFDADGNFVKSILEGVFGELIPGRLFFGPSGIAFDDAGFGYVGDFSNDRIIKFDSAGDIIATYGSTGTELGQLQGPSALAISPVTGNFVVNDQFNNRVQIFSPEWQPLLAFGGPGSGLGQLLQPVDVEIDQFDNIYVTDLINSRVQAFDSLGNFLAAFGEPARNADGLVVPPQPLGAPPYGMPLDLRPGVFNWIAGSYYDNNANKLYLGDFFQGRVQVLDVFASEATAASAVPEPTTMIGSAIVGLGLAARKFRQRRAKSN